MYRQLLSSLGLRAALGVFAGVHAAAFAVGYAMMAERRPARARAPLVWFDRAFFRDGVFWSLAGCFFFTVLCVVACFFAVGVRATGLTRATCSGYLGPIFLLPTFTVQIAPGMSPIVSPPPLPSLPGRVPAFTRQRAPC